MFAQDTFAAAELWNHLCNGRAQVSVGELIESLGRAQESFTHLAEHILG